MFSVYVNLCFHLIVGDNRCPWVRARLNDGSFYYFHLNKLEGCWEKPKGFIQNSVFLQQHQIQVTYQRVISEWVSPNVFVHTTTNRWE